MRNEPMHDLPDLLLTKPERVVCTTLSAWLPAWRAAASTPGHDGAFSAAIAAAWRADRLAWAFFAGYQGALRWAFGDGAAAADDRLRAFCVNESGRKITEITTTLSGADDNLRLHGAKSWALAGLDPLDLFVLARRDGGRARGPGSLVVVRVPSDAPGVAFQPARPQPVVPELPHTAVTFDAVAITRAQCVAGDGYADHARPFRLREDLFVSGCALACLLGEAHAAAWPTLWRQRCMAAIVALHACTRRSPVESASEVLAAGALSLAGDVFQEAEPHWACGDPAAAERWRRDLPLLAGGKEARRLRAQAAWARVSVS